MDKVNIPEWLNELDTHSTNRFINILQEFNSSKLDFDDFKSKNINDFLKLKLPTSLSLNELLILALKSGIEPEQVVKLISWKQFESLTAAILNYQGWETQQNIKFRSPTKFNSWLEFDVIASKVDYETVLFIDCKRYQSPAPNIVNKAATRQKERLGLLFTKLPELSYDSRFYWLKKKKGRLLPLLLTWRDHQIKLKDDVAIVPIAKFSDFLKNLQKYREFLYQITFDL